MHTSTRYDFLDWLRVLAIALLVFYHTGMMFVGWGWHIENEALLTELRWPMSIAHRLRMPLLFVIAGAGLWFALRRRSGGEVLRERSLRLLLPALVGMLLIVPPQLYYERLFRGQWDGGYLAFFWERVLQFQPYPQGDFSWHHLWFIVYLYVYVLLLLPLLLLWWRRHEGRLQPGLWLYGLAVPLALNEALLSPYFPETHNLIADWYLFNHYPVYILHQTIIVAVGYFVIQQAWHPWVKLAAVAVVALVGSALIYELAIRRWALLRLIFGMKPQAAPTRPGQVTELAPST